MCVGGDQQSVIYYVISPIPRRFNLEKFKDFVMIMKCLLRCCKKAKVTLVCFCVSKVICCLMKHGSLLTFSSMDF